MEAMQDMQEDDKLEQRKAVANECISLSSKDRLLS